MHTLKDRIGFIAQSPATSTADEEKRLREFVNLKPAARGYPIVGKEEDFPFLDLGKSLIASFQEKTRLLSDYLCPNYNPSMTTLTASTTSPLPNAASPSTISRMAASRPQSHPSKPCSTSWRTGITREKDSPIPPSAPSSIARP